MPLLDLEEATYFLSRGCGVDLFWECVEVLNLDSPWMRSQLWRLPMGGPLHLVMCAFYSCYNLE